SVRGRHPARHHGRPGRAGVVRPHRRGLDRGSVSPVQEGGAVVSQLSEGRVPAGNANEAGGVGGRPPTGNASELVLENVSRWYGNVVAVNGVSMRIGPGVTGLLGPNGAGKSTLIHMMGGFLAPSSGTVTLDGEPIWQNPGIYRRLGLVPERETAYDFLTGEQFVVAMAKLHRLPDPKSAA